MSETEPKLSEYEAVVQHNRSTDGPPKLVHREAEQSSEGQIVAVFEPATERGAHILTLEHTLVDVEALR